MRSGDGIYLGAEAGEGVEGGLLGACDRIARSTKRRGCSVYGTSKRQASDLKPGNRKRGPRCFYRHS
jgi:hypothetical protein